MVYGQTYSAGVENATRPVSPSQISDKSRQAEGHAEEDGDVPFMLPPDDAVFAEVGDVGHAWLMEPWTALVLAMASRYSSGLEAL